MISTNREGGIVENNTYTTDQIVAIGGQEWARGNVERVYLNDWHDMIGLSVNYYKSGNVSSAKLDGELISNTKAARLIGTSVYLERGRIVTHLARTADASGLDGAELERRLLTEIARRVPPAE